MASYNWDATSSATAIFVNVTDTSQFVTFLSTKLHPTYEYHTPAKVAATVKRGSGNQLGDGLLGSISEFSVYVICCDQHGYKHPFIRCFRAPDPLGSANFPLVDISIFRPKKNPAKDRLHLQEVKATRENPDYFAACEDDFGRLYERGRLASTAEQIKWDLQMSKRGRYVTRVNDCLGTCPKDSEKLHLIPTGVSGGAADKDDCVRRVETIVANLQSAGWPSVHGMYLRVPNIERTYKAFACGKGLGNE